MLTLLLADFETKIEEGIERDQALAQGYGWIADILLITLAGVVFLLALFFIRRLIHRWSRRQLEAIEQDRAARRDQRTSGRGDTWGAGAERYVDRDKLTDEEPAYGSGADDAFDDDEDEGDDEPPGYATDEDGPEDERDPYGLFEDKPYRDLEDDEHDEDEDEDDDEDDLEDPDEDLR